MKDVRTYVGLAVAGIIASVLIAAAVKISGGKL